MDTRPVLVIVSSPKCGHCVNFRKNYFGSFKDLIEKENKVRFFDIELPTFDTKIPEKYPFDLQRFSKWFPTFILITGNSWNSCINDKKLKLDGCVFNGIPMAYDTPKADLVQGAENPTPENLIKWINEKLGTENFKKNNTQNINYNNNSVLAETKAQNTFTISSRSNQVEYSPACRGGGLHLNKKG